MKRRRQRCDGVHSPKSLLNVVFLWKSWKKMIPRVQTKPCMDTFLDEKNETDDHGQLS